MPLTLLIVGVAIVVSLLRGGRFSRIALADLRWSGLLFVGLGLQIALDLGAARGLLEGTAGYVVLLASQVLVLVWVVANWWRPGMALIALGLLCNAIVIGANGAMPVSQEAIAALDIGDVEVPPGKHVLADENTRLVWLGDVHPVPPIRTIISIGDVLLAAGLVPLTHHLMTYRPPHERRGGRRASAEAIDQA